MFNKQFIATIDTTVPDDTNNSDQKQRNPSTANRRKLFETPTKSKENEPEDTFDVTDQADNFERSSEQRRSIAERRKMYENRSLSVQEASNITVDKQGASPVMLRRKNSLKAQKNGEDVLKEENRKTEPVLKQQSLDTQTVHAVTPKRTSTVFGMCSKFVCCMLF